LDKESEFFFSPSSGGVTATSIEDHPDVAGGPVSRRPKKIFYLGSKESAWPMCDG
jgi:hypothetical protein